MCVAVFGVIIKYSVDDMRGGMADVGGPHVCQSVSQSVRVIISWD